MRYEVKNGNAKGARQAVLGIYQALGNEAERIFEAQGLNNVQPDGWYDMQKILDVFNAIADRNANPRSIFVQTGLFIGENSMVSEGVHDLETFFSMIDMAFNMNHQGDGLGALDVKKVANGHLRIVDTTPYPRDFHYGVFFGFARLFNENDANFTLEYDNPTDPDTFPKVFHLRW